MKISVIIPVYNTERFLPRCIESVLSQSFSDFELLLIDDGSTDSCSAICNAYSEKDNRVLVFHQDNSGVSSARNLGLDHAQGEWVTFIDSDDFVEKDYFSIPFVEQVDLYAQNWSYANGITKEKFSPAIVDKEHYVGFLQDNIHTDMFRTACCFFFKTSIIREYDIRFETRFRLGEDTLFVLDYYRYATSIQIMGNSCYIYNRQDNWNDKYNLSWSEANGYLDAFMDRYESLPCESMALLGFMFPFIQKRIKAGESHMALRWALSKPMLRCKKMKLPNRGIKFRMKYYFAKLVSVFVHV